MQRTLKQAHRQCGTAKKNNHRLQKWAATKNQKRYFLGWEKETGLDQTTFWVPNGSNGTANNCLNANSSSYLETSGGQSSIIFSTLIRHLWQLKIVVFLHWCLICAVVLFKKNTFNIPSLPHLTKPIYNIRLNDVWLIVIAPFLI